MIKKQKIKIHLLLCIILIGCSSKTKEYEAEDVLMNIANHFLVTEETRMLDIDSVFNADNALPVRFDITQRNDYRGFYSFLISPSNLTIFYMGGLPTKITKIGNRDMYLFMSEEKPLSKKELPDELFNDVDWEKMINESDWDFCLDIIMCKKCLNSVVVLDRFISTENTKQFNEFNCVCEHDYKKNKQEIIIEKPIIEYQK